jgi:hypothetical protein
MELNKVKAMADQLDQIKTRALSIGSLIQDYLIADIQDDLKLAELIESINMDKEVMEIHIEFASELFDWDSTV